MAVPKWDRLAVLGWDRLADPGPLRYEVRVGPLGRTEVGTIGRSVTFESDPEKTTLCVRACCAFENIRDYLDVQRVRSAHQLSGGRPNPEPLTGVEHTRVRVAVTALEVLLDDGAKENFRP